MKNFFLIIISIALVISAEANEKISGQYGFVKNSGQIKDQNLQPNSDVLYHLSQNDLNVLLKQNGFSYDCFKQDDQIKFHRIDIHFIGANCDAQIEMINPSQAKFNYFTSSQHTIQTSVARTIKYSNIYNGIDLLCSLNDNNLFEYDFIIHPGANINDIQLKYSGALNSTLNSNGQIELKTQFGKVTEYIPHCFIYENNVSVEVEVKQIGKNIFAFKCDYPSTEKTLVIDPIPSRDWGTYYGGNSNERGEDLSYDQMGGIYLGGYTSSASNIATSGTYQNVYAGNIDAYIAKFDTSGALLWASYFGGSDNETGLSVCANSNGLVWLSGYTNSTNGIASTNAHQTTYGGGLNDAFLACFNGTNGLLNYATYYGGMDDDKAFGLECDDLNRVYLVGHAASANNIATAGAYQDSTWGLDAYLAVFDGVSGSRIWATYFGGAFYESFTDVSVDADYNIYCSGRTFSSSNVASSGAHQTIYGGINFADVALVKFDSSGTRLWSTYFGGSGDDFGLGVRAANGYVYVAGQTFSPNNISSFNAYQATYGGNGDGYYARFLDSGVLTYASYYGDTSTQVFEDIVVDLSGRTFVCGSTNSPTGGTPGTHQQNYGGQIDGSLSCFDSFGSPAWTTYYGGNFYDDLKSIALVDNTLIFSVGTTTSFNNIATPGVHQSSKMGVDDAYMVKFSQLLPSIGIDENEGRTSLAVYPNPVTAGQEINFSSALPVQAIFKMYSISGQVVFESIINDSKVVLPARKFPKGEYQFTISDKNNLIGSGKISYQ